MRNTYLFESYQLTHLPLDKVAAILADDKYIFLNGNDRIPIRISLKFVPRSPIGNKPALVQLMAWQKSLPEINAYQVLWHIYAALRGDESTNFFKFGGNEIYAAFHHYQTSINENDISHLMINSIAI